MPRMPPWPPGWSASAQPTCLARPEAPFSPIAVLMWLLKPGWGFSPFFPSSFFQDSKVLSHRAALQNPPPKQMSPAPEPPLPQKAICLCPLLRLVHRASSLGVQEPDLYISTPPSGLLQCWACSKLTILDLGSSLSPPLLALGPLLKSPSLPGSGSGPRAAPGPAPLWWGGWAISFLGNFLGLVEEEGLPKTLTWYR